MSTAATLTSPTTIYYCNSSQRPTKRLLVYTTTTTLPPLVPLAKARLMLKYPTRARTRSRSFFSPVMEWQDCTVKKEIDVPIGVAYKAYLDRESIPRWMPFISSVQILKDKPDLSRWSLKYEAFGRDIEFSWLARNMQPIPNQKIHWRSLEGLPNRGAVRFFPKGPTSCLVEILSTAHVKTFLYFWGEDLSLEELELTVSYEVPAILVPVAAALQPFLENLLARGLERFATFAKSY